MKVQVFITQSEGGFVEVSVVKEGLSSGPGHKYENGEKARRVLEALGFPPDVVEQKLRSLSQTPPSVLLKFAPSEIADDVLASQGFAGAALTAV